MPRRSRGGAAMGARASIQHRRAEAQAHRDEEQDREVLFEHRRRLRSGAHCAPRPCVAPRLSPVVEVSTASRTARSVVPTGRLELPRLSPLPPQDSVSTNFTTSACSSASSGAPAAPAAPCGPKESSRHFGTSPAFDGVPPPAQLPAFPAAWLGDYAAMAAELDLDIDYPTARFTAERLFAEALATEENQQ